jgi:HSP20 family protein
MKEQRLQRWDPFSSAFSDNPFGVLRRLTGDMERFFDFPMPGFWPREPRLIGEAAWIPSIDVFEKDGSLVIRADLPGLTKEDVNIEVTDEAITLKGERKKEIEEEKEGLYRQERAYGSFFRAVPLPEGVKPEDVKATFTNGVLEVTMPLPTAKKELKARRVEIQEAAGEKQAKSAA